MTYIQNKTQQQQKEWKIEKKIPYDAVKVTITSVNIQRRSGYHHTI